MTKKIIVLDAFGSHKNPNKTPVWWKVKKYFIHQENIRAISRKGKGTAISLFHGDDLLVDINYDKVSILLPSDNNKI